MLGKIIAITAIVLIVGGAVIYIIKSKKSGRKCIGCPAGCSCSAKKGKKGADRENSCCCSHQDE